MTPPPLAVWHLPFAIWPQFRIPTGYHLSAQGCPERFRGYPGFKLSFRASTESVDEPAQSAAKLPNRNVPQAAALLPDAPISPQPVAKLATADDPAILQQPAAHIPSFHHVIQKFFLELGRPARQIHGRHPA